MARIALVLRPDRGGAFTHVAQLSSALAEFGHQVFVCGPFDEADDRIGGTVVPLPIERPVSMRADVAAAASLTRILRRVRPDLIHAHGSKGGVIARIAHIAMPRVPVVFTPHLYAFDNHFANPGQRHLYRGIERVLAPLATRVIAVCESERAHAAQIGSAARTRVVFNGIDPVDMSVVHPVVAQLASEGPVICTVAELRESKGVLTLVEAMALVHAAHPSARLAIAGDGDERRRIEARVVELGLSDAVRLLGATHGADSVLAGASVFVNAAYAEAFPYTVIEAMSACLPIVATDVGGTHEAVGRDGSCGLLVPKGDAEALAQSLIKILDDPDSGRRMGAKARTTYERRFTATEMIAGIQKVYAELGVQRSPLEPQTS